MNYTTKNGLNVSIMKRKMFTCAHYGKENCRNYKMKNGSPVATIEKN